MTNELRAKIEALPRKQLVRSSPDYMDMMMVRRDGRYLDREAVLAVFDTNPAEATSREGEDAAEIVAAWRDHMMREHPGNTLAKAYFNYAIKGIKDAALSREKEARAEGFKAGIEAAAGVCDEMETRTNRPALCAKRIRDLTPTVADAEQQGES